MEAYSKSFTEIKKVKEVYHLFNRYAEFIIGDHLRSLLAVNTSKKMIDGMNKYLNALFMCGNLKAQNANLYQF